MNLPTVLFVDDESNILQSVRRIMRKVDVKVETTTSPEEAIDLVQSRAYAVVVSDQRMPGMGGVELLEHVRTLSPDTVRIILTGYADVQASVDAINKGAVYRYLNKPWEDDDLRNCIKQGVDQYLLIQENRRLQELTERQNDELRDLNENLKQKVMDRTWEVLRLNQKLERSFMGAVEAMARLGEMHSRVLGSHAKRVAMLSTEIAKQVGVSGKDLLQIEVAATLHDIGKMLVDTTILKKQEDRLASDEQAALREHPAQGEAIVRMVPNNQDAARFVRHHHERFDGRGYPDGQVATEIPLGSRIIAVANAYDKLLNARHSFTNTTPFQACQLVEDRSGSEFDPAVVEALHAVVRKIEGEVESGYEIELGLKDLIPGMVLSRDLKADDGRLLAQKNHAIESAQIDALRRLDAKEPIMQGIFVYRKWPRSNRGRVEFDAA